MHFPMQLFVFVFSLVTALIAFSSSEVVRADGSDSAISNFKKELDSNFLIGKKTSLFDGKSLEPW